MTLFVYLTADVFRWSTKGGTAGGMKDHHLPGASAPGSEGTIGATTCCLGNVPEISPDIVQFLWDGGDFH